MGTRSSACVIQKYLSGVGRGWGARFNWEWSVFSIYRVSWRGSYQYSYGNLQHLWFSRWREGPLINWFYKGGGGVVPLLFVGSYQYSIPMKSYSTCNFSGGGGVFSLNLPMICTPVMMWHIFWYTGSVKLFQWFHDRFLLPQNVSVLLELRLHVTSLRFPTNSPPHPPNIPPQRPKHALKYYVRCKFPIYHIIIIIGLCLRCLRTTKTQCLCYLLIEKNYI